MALEFNNNLLLPGPNSILGSEYDVHIADVPSLRNQAPGLELSTDTYNEYDSFYTPLDGVEETPLREASHDLSPMSSYFSDDYATDTSSILESPLGQMPDCYGTTESGNILDEGVRISVLDDTEALDIVPVVKSDTRSVESPMSTTLTRFGRSDEPILQQLSDSASTQLMMSDSSFRKLWQSKMGAHVDITEHLGKPQKEVAKLLKIPTSTLSKRWKEATNGRKWPYSRVKKIDRRLLAIAEELQDLHENKQDTVEQSTTMEVLNLIKERTSNLQPVVIRV